MMVIDKKRLAVDCNECLCWLPVCGAECCKEFSIDKKLLLSIEEDYLLFGITLDSDLEWYVTLRGMDYYNGLLRVPLEKAYPEDDKVIINSRCSLLTTDNHCSGHPTNKPLICQSLKITGPVPLGITVTKHCLRRFK